MQKSSEPKVCIKYALYEKKAGKIPVGRYEISLDIAVCGES